MGKKVAIFATSLSRGEAPTKRARFERCKDFPSWRCIHGAAILKAAYPPAAGGLELDIGRVADYARELWDSGCESRSSSRREFV
jgi:hypothetical protein